MTTQSLQERIENLLSVGFQNRWTNSMTAKAILALVEELPKDKENLSVRDVYLFDAGVAHGKLLHKDASHSHCWDQKQPSACGIPLDKHTQCCLCDLKVQTDTPEKWGEEFSFRFLDYFDDGKKISREFHDIKDFIRQLLTQQKAEMVEGFGYFAQHRPACIAYAEQAQCNCGLNDLLTKLSTHE